MDNWTISDLIITLLINAVGWTSGAIGLFYARRKAAQKRREDQAHAEAAERQREIDRDRKDDEIRQTLINEVIRRNDELANQVEKLNEERLEDVRKLQGELKTEKERNQTREEGLQRALGDITLELKQNLDIQTKEREFYRQRIDEHAAETSKVIENQGRTLAIAEQLGKDNEDLRRRVGELETKVSGYATLQKQLAEALEENVKLSARVEHLEGQIAIKDAEILALQTDIASLKSKSDSPVNPPIIEGHFTAETLPPEGGNAA